MLSSMYLWEIELNWIEISCYFLYKIVNVQSLTSIIFDIYADAQATILCYVCKGGVDDHGHVMYSFPSNEYFLKSL